MKRHLNGVSLAGWWWPDFSCIWIHSFTKKKKVGPPLKKLWIRSWKYRCYLFSLSVFQGALYQLHSWRQKNFVLHHEFDDYGLHMEKIYIILALIATNQRVLAAKGCQHESWLLLRLDMLFSVTYPTHFYILGHNFSTVKATSGYWSLEVVSGVFPHWIQLSC